MKKSLLTLSLLAAVASASATEQYIIKDGKLATGVEILPYAKESAGPLFEEGVTMGGATAAKITPQVQYTETRFYVPEGIDLKKTWTVEVEFYYNAADLDSVDHAGANKWQVMDIGYHADTTGGNYTLSGVLADNTFDVKVKNKAGQWNTESQFIYINQHTTSIKEVIFGWQRQIDPTVTTIGPVYIKNLKFVGEGNKPFYYENFDLLSTISSESTSNINKYVADEGTGDVTDSPDYALAGSENSNPGGFVTPIPWYSGQATDGSTRQNDLSIKRLFEDEATDGSGYYDSEILHGLDIVLPTGTGRKAAGRCGRSFCLIPLDGTALQQTTTLTLDFIAKWDASRTTEKFSDETDEANLVLPVKYAFVDDAAAAATGDLDLATDKLLDGKWTAYSCSIPFVAGKKYLALVFDRPSMYSYVVDNIQLTSDAVYVSEAEFDADDTWVLKFNKDEKILNDVVKPNVSIDRASGVVTVANEGVERVVVLNVNAAEEASANGNQINVSNLASGVHIVKAYTAEGVLISKIVK